MLRIILTAFVFPLLLLFGSPGTGWSSPQKTPDSKGQSGTLQKMIVENGTLTMDLDVDRLNADGSLAAKVQQLRFTVAANSFFNILVFNDLLRGAEGGSMALIPEYSTVPPSLSRSINQLALEKLPAGEQFDLAMRDAKTGFTFFNVAGHQYDYDAIGQLLSIHGGRLLVSKEFANTLGRPSDAGAAVGKLSIGAVMRPIEIRHVVNGETKSMVMPPLGGAATGADAPVPGPDVIVGEIESVQQFGSARTQVGLAAGTDSCNIGDQPVDWFQLPSTDHPVVPQNLYRMSEGTFNNDRFEQIGHSWMKHTFFALEGTVCGACNTSNCETGTHLCPGCSDPYSASLNGDQNQIGSRAWINPFTGSFPSGPNNHFGHIHDGVSHRIRVEANDLDPTMNQGATYFAEAAYISPHEYTWCQSHPGQCNMYNNVSYRQFGVYGGPSNFTFSAVGATVRMQPAIMAWANTGAVVNQIQPDPGNDGIWFTGYKVTNPSVGVWRYEYALYNMNLDRAIQSFSVPLAAGTNISNIGFHAPPQEPGWTNDGTFNNQGHSSTPWTVTQAPDSITWSTETIAQNQNANAIRFGTLYNFRFDADQSPQSANATVGYFKTGSPMAVAVRAPAGGTPTPTPTATPTATATSTPTSTPTPTATPTPTPRPTPTARPSPGTRPRPTPAPRP